MTHHPQVGLLALAILSAAAGGCESKPLGGPPELRLGRDECRECGMIISEDRCSAALLIDRDRRRDYVLFDDIGCLLDWQRESLDGAVVHQQFVHDFATRQWASAAEATYLLADPQKLVTPMSTGMVAFSTRGAAESTLAQYGGEILDFGAMKAARKAWNDKRREARPGG
jgi:nitrous oxide reductase accessory protein NosL